MSAAAGIVVIEMNTPISAPAFASVIDTTPTSAATTATTTENRLGELIRSETGRWPCRNASGVRPDARMHSANSSVTTIASTNPVPSTSRPVRTAMPSLRSSPRATAAIALYSGPTTIAPTIRICEFVRMPQAPISPAKTSSAKKLGAYSASSRIRASTTRHTGVRSPCRDGRQPWCAAGSASAASICSIITELVRSSPRSISRCST
ncbi:MAG TPA: hypothetical protein VEJ42_06455 [Streptosporangiaceae bacterium]|nr:hypothetical protein [Streptosporangiaceae bacterium]